MRDTALRSVVMAFCALLPASVARACEGDSCANGLAYQAYGPKSAPVLAVFVHGDVSSGGPADYMYSYAKSFAAGRRNVVAVALLRPGYYDRAGKRSSGSDGGRRDTFDSGSNRTIAGAIRDLKSKFGASKVIALGHSGGAGAIGVIAGNHAGLLNGIVLASCPCDVAAWSASRGNRRARSSQSPVNYVSSIPSGTPVVAVTGSADDNTRPELAKDYVARAQAAGLPARLVLTGGGHGFGAVAGPAVGALGSMAR